MTAPLIVHLSMYCTISYDLQISQTPAQSIERGIAN